MSETSALQAFIDTTNSRLTALETPPVVNPQIQWSSGIELGNLSAWSEQVNTGNANSTAVLLLTEQLPIRVNKPSLWAMKQAWLGPSGTTEASGTRIMRYPEINTLAKAGTTFYYTWWDFFPTAIAYGTGGWYNHWQIASADGTPNGYIPIWVLGIDPGMTPTLDWSPSGAAPTAGPHFGESGHKHYSSPLIIPVGQWVKFEAQITPRSDFTGAVKIWLNGQVLFDLASVKTQFPLVSQGLLAWVANNCYGVGLPVPFVHYVDDVSISLGRLS